MLLSLNKPFEIVDEGELDHLRRKGRAFRIDKLAFEFLREQRGSELFSLLLEKFGADPRTLAANDLDAFDPLAMLPILEEIPAPAIGRRHIDLPALTDRQRIGAIAACIASETYAASSVITSLGAL